MRTLLLRLDSYIGRHEKAILAVLLLVFFGRAYAISRITPMVPDEYLTYLQAQLPNLDAVFRTMRGAPAVVDPPLDPVLSFLAFRLPLPLPLGLRIPSFIGYAAMMVSLFVLVRRWAPASLALIAFVLPMILPVFAYAVEARPYALVLGFSGCALIFWQRAAEQRSGRLRWLLLLFVALAGAILAQYLAPLLLMPFVAAELWRVLRSRADAAIWITLACAAMVMAAYLPFLPAASKFRQHPWHGVSFEDLQNTYMLTISPAVIVLLAACVFVYFAAPAWERKTEPENETAFSSEYESVALAALYLAPVMAFIAAKLVTHSYVPRYSLMFVLAAVLLLTALIAILTRGNRAYLVLVLLCLVAQAAHPLTSFFHPAPVNPSAIVIVSPENVERFPDLAIAVPDWYLYMRVYLFGPADLKARMVLVSNTLSGQAVHNALQVAQPEYHEFTRSHTRFFFVDDATGKREQLVREGRRLEWAATLGGEDVYLVTAANPS
jgi:4-amino-4-deoxy-L-arabinose transferase-like glycosyltransferase